MKPSDIGGQAVMEGVMMKNDEKYAVAVRKPNNEIDIEIKNTVKLSKKYPLFEYPLLRGMAAFVESLSLGMSSLTHSASFYEDEEEKEESKFEKKLNEMTKGHADSVLNGITVAFAIVLALGIFVVLPMVLAGILGNVIESWLLLAVLEGVFRVLIFIAYIVLISFMKDIRRLFMYHGAEHKTINCVENCLPLTVENVKEQSREHKRCGTSFMLTVMILSVIFFMFIRVGHPLLRLAIRLLLIPVIAGISYEFIRYAGKHDSAVINILSRPGMWLQALTTREPDEDMIEVAIRSVEAVFDWKTFIEEAKAEVQVQEEVAAAKESPVAKKSSAAEKKAVPKKNSVAKKSPAAEKSPVAEELAVAAQTAESQKEAPVKEGAKKRSASAQTTESQKEAPVKEGAKKRSAAVQTAEPQKEASVKEGAKKRSAAVQTAEPQTEAPVKEGAKKRPAAAQTAESQKEAPAEEVKEQSQPLEIDIAQLFDIKLDTANSNKSKSKSKAKTRTPKTEPKKDPIPEVTKTVSAMKDEEDDDILKALDMYFEFHGKKSVMEISDENTDGEENT